MAVFKAPGSAARPKRIAQGVRPLAWPVKSDSGARSGFGSGPGAGAREAQSPESWGLQQPRSVPAVTPAWHAAALPPLPPQLRPLADESVANELAGEVAAPLTFVVERVQALQNEGLLSAATAAPLLWALEDARQAAIRAQHLLRLQNNPPRQQAEPVDITKLVRDALTRRAAEMEGRGLAWSQALQSVTVVADAALCYLLCHALIDWALQHGRQRVEARLEHRPLAHGARLTLRVDTSGMTPVSGAPSAAGALPDGTAGRLDAEDASWAAESTAARLLRAVADRMGVTLTPLREAGHASMTLDFDEVVQAPMGGGLTMVELDDELAGALGHSPLAAARVVVLSGQRDNRQRVREALRPLGAMVEFVSSVAEARHVLDGTAPEALLFDSGQANAAFLALCAELRAKQPTMGLIELLDSGAWHESGPSELGPLTRIGPEVLGEALPTALLQSLAPRL